MSLAPTQMLEINWLLNKYERKKGKKGGGRGE